MSLTWMLALKVSLVFFMAGNLLDMGLRLDIRNALRGLGNARFVLLALFWGFVFGPGVASPRGTRCPSLPSSSLPSPIA